GRFAEGSVWRRVDRGGQPPGRPDLDFAGRLCVRPQDLQAQAELQVRGRRLGPGQRCQAAIHERRQFLHPHPRSEDDEGAAP
ncbi:hypothetical protein LTR94_038080, partial [Friedmanniomyces endolithicus]